MAYNMPQGDRRGNAYEFYDWTYDGEWKGNELHNGLGCLVDGDYGPENFKLSYYAQSKCLIQPFFVRSLKEHSNSCPYFPQISRPDFLQSQCLIAVGRECRASVENFFEIEAIQWLGKCQLTMAASEMLLPLLEKLSPPERKIRSSIFCCRRSRLLNQPKPLKFSPAASPERNPSD